MHVPPLCFTVNLSMTRGDLVKPLTVTIAVAVCCRCNDSSIARIGKL